MQEFPERPDQLKIQKYSRTAKIVGGVLVGLVLIGGGVAVGAVTDHDAITPTISPSPGDTIPTPSPTPTPEPVDEADPMDEAMDYLKSRIYIEKTVNVMHQSQAMGLGQARIKQIWIASVSDPKEGTMGDAWVDASKKYGIGLSALFDEFWYRYV